MAGNHEEEGGKERTELTLKSKQQENQPQHPQAELQGCHLVILRLLKPHSGAQTSARAEGEWAATRTFRAGSPGWNVAFPHRHTPLSCLQTRVQLNVSTL